MPRQHPNRLWQGRTFGVEMEFLKRTRGGGNISAEFVNSKLAEAVDFPVQGMGDRYSAQSNGRAWEVQYDSTAGWEVSTPALELDEHGECAELKAGCDALTRNVKPKIDSSCGLHVHVDVSDFDWKEIQKLLGLWVRYEPFFFSMVAASRKNLNWCIPLRATTWANAFDVDQTQDYAAVHALKATSRREFESRCANLGKYRTLRMNMWALNGRVEFRMHSGTISYTKIRQWVRLILSLVGRVKTSTMGTTGRLPIAVRPLSRPTGFGPKYVLGALGMGPHGGPFTNESTLAIYDSLMTWIPERQRKFNPVTRTRRPRVARTTRPEMPDPDFTRAERMAWDARVTA